MLKRFGRGKEAPDEHLSHVVSQATVLASCWVKAISTSASIRRLPDRIYEKDAVRSALVNRTAPAVASITHIDDYRASARINGYEEDTMAGGATPYLWAEASPHLAQLLRLTPLKERMHVTASLISSY